MKKELTESLEKYLLAIYYIVRKNQAARVKDVSLYLNIGVPSTSDAVKTLAKKGFINYVPYGIITLTKKGEQKSLDKIKRHDTIYNFLDKVLSVEKDKLEDCTLKIEYAMSEDILDKFIYFLDFMQNCSCKNPMWINNYKNYLLNNEKYTDKCGRCISEGGHDKCCNHN